MGKATADFEKILEQIRQARNFDFRNYKRPTLQRRIDRRMADRGCRNYVEYLSLLQREPDEFDALISMMLVKVTSFFRDPAVWRELEKKIIPMLLAQKRSGEEFRVWCAGCSTGEEAYSIALLLADALPNRGNRPIKIFATDVDEAALAVARRGIYSVEQSKDVPRALLKRWFESCPEGYLVGKDIRRMVVFGLNNLVSGAPISRLDLLVCRNVFIYLDAGLQKRVLTRFHYALNRDGALVLGKSELIPFAEKVFEPLDLSRRIYRRNHRQEAPLASQDQLLGILEQEDVTRVTAQTRAELSILGQFYSDVLDSISVPLIVTGMDGSVSFWNQAASRLWNRKPEEVLGKKLTAIGLPGMSGALLVEKTNAVRDGRTEFESADGVVNGNGMAAMEINIQVSLLRDLGREVSGVLYLIRDTTSLRKLEADLGRVSEELTSASNKLRSSNEQLQSSNEELETTNEELQSSNEELQTTNEELQSTNEELETTNEELQSTNSELDATNRELAHRTEEMNLLGLYQRRIIRSLSAAVAVLDPYGRITSWNLAAERLLGVAESEALGQVIWTLPLPGVSRALLSRLKRAFKRNHVFRLSSEEYQLPGGGRGYASISGTSLTDNGNDLGGVLIFEDQTQALSIANTPQRLKDVGQDDRRS